MTRPLLPKTELLANIKRLNTYIKERELNLPSEVFNASDDVALAKKSLEGYNKQLGVYADIQSEAKLADKQRLEDSAKLFEDIKADLRMMHAELEEKFGKLHINYKAAGFELLKNIKMITR